MSLNIFWVNIYILFVIGYRIWIWLIWKEKQYNMSMNWWLYCDFACVEMDFIKRLLNEFLYLVSGSS